MALKNAAGWELLGEVTLGPEIFWCVSAGISERLRIERLEEGEHVRRLWREGLKNVSICIWSDLWIIEMILLIGIAVAPAAEL